MEVLIYRLIIVYIILVFSDKVRSTAGYKRSNFTQKTLLLRYLHTDSDKKDQELNDGTVKEFLERGDKKRIGENPITKLIPMLATPFILQTTFLPMMLLGIKFMLIQSIFLGKLAVIFWLVNLLRNNIKDQQGQLYSHNIHLSHS